MPVTMQQVLVYLNSEEPDYTTAATLGPEAVPHLERLVGDPDPMLASKAAYLASLIHDEQSLDVLSSAARHADPVVRVAAAAAARNLPGARASDILVPLVGDVDEGVRKVAFTSVREGMSDALRARIEEVARTERVPEIRDISSQALWRIGGTAPSRRPSVTTGVQPVDEPEEGFGGGSIEGGAERTESTVGEEGMGGGDVRIVVNHGLEVPSVSEQEGMGGGGSSDLSEGSVLIPDTTVEGMGGGGGSSIDRPNASTVGGEGPYAPG